MSNITRERAQEIFLGNGPEPTASEERELARIALASLEAEPVSVNDDMAYAFHHAISDSSLGSDEVEEIKAGLRAAFANVTAPPAPASVPEWTNEQCLEFLSIAFRHAEIKGDLELDDIRLGVKMVNGSRAAMLQGADGTLTNEGTIPANTPCKDAPEHIWLQTAGVWPENGEFSELTWCSDNQHKDDTLYVRADVVTGNSPVIPDGWVTWDELQKRHYLGEGKPVMVFGSTSDFCSKHPQTKRVVHPYMCTASMPPQPCYYCPECEPDVAEWEAKWGRK